VPRDGPSLCSLIHRAPETGSLWLSNQGYVTDISENTAELHTRGLDVAADWRFSLPAPAGSALGSASLSLAGTWTANAITQPFAGARAADCAGYYGPTCGQPRPRWRHILRLNWATPWGVSVDGAWRFIAAVRLDASSTQPALAQPFDAANLQLGARSYFDLSLAWRIDPHLTVRIGANNLFDRDPPLFAFAGQIGNGNTFPSSYDSLGRFVFVNMVARL
jgi:outer membrane receptor protein involved in Fe transport